MVKVLTADPSSLNRERPVEKSCLPRHPVLTDVADSQQKKESEWKAYPLPVCRRPVVSSYLGSVTQSLPMMGKLVQAPKTTR